MPITPVHEQPPAAQSRNGIDWTEQLAALVDVDDSNNITSSDDNKSSNLINYDFNDNFDYDVNDNNKSTNNEVPSTV